MAQLPASLAVAGAAVVLFGLLPRASVACAWTVVGVLVLIALFGQVLQLSQPMTRRLAVHPRAQAPRAPRSPATPLLWLSLAVVALVAVGWSALRHRDIEPLNPGIALCIQSPINCTCAKRSIVRAKYRRETMTVAMIRPLQRPVPLRQSVYDALIDLIVGGELPPGQHMVETDLGPAARRRQAADPRGAAPHGGRGWVDLRPSQGAFVHVPTDSEVDELLDVRALLEAENGQARRGSTAARARRPATAQLARLREICREGQAAAEADDFGSAVAANNAFHAEIAVIGGNAVLAELADIVGRRVQWYYRMVAPARGHGSWAEHAEMIDVIEAGDPERAQALARKHTETNPAGLPPAQISQLRPG